MMLTWLLAAALSAEPQFIEPWGLVLKAEGDSIVVTEVRPRSPAHFAKVQPGAELLRIVEPRPTRKRAVGLLDAESLTDAIATLAEAPVDVLVLEFANGTKTVERQLWRVSVVEPKTLPEIEKMPPYERMAYLSKAAMQVHRTPRHPEVRFEDERAPSTAWVDPQRHELVSVDIGGATGMWVFARRTLDYGCEGSRAVSVTVRGLGLPAAISADLRPQKLEGGEHDFLLPLAKLADVQACPAVPLVQRVELELTCEQGPVVYGRSKLRLAVQCRKRGQEALGTVFASTTPRVVVDKIVEGSKHFWVQAPHVFAPVPVTIDVLVLGDGGREIAALRNAWRAMPEEGWGPVQVPAPPVSGDYSIVFVASWDDGSQSRTAAKTVHVITVPPSRRLSEPDYAAMQAFDQRYFAEFRDLCSEGAIAWLRRQPEIAWVEERSQPPRGYSYAVKNGQPMMVHCGSH